MAISVPSLVKIRIRSCGNPQASRANSADAPTEKRMAIPIIFSMASVSCFPQYWAAIIVAPDATPE